MADERPRTRTRTAAMEGIAVLNPDTGEAVLVTGHVEYEEQVGRGKGLAKNKRRHKVWALVDTVSGMARLSLSEMEARLFWQVVSHTHPDYDSAHISPTQLAKTMGTRPSYVSRLIHDLVERRVLIRIDKQRYRANRWLIFRGSVTEWEATTADDPEPQWER